MSKQANDTLSVPRDPINHANFSMPFWEGTRDKKVMVQYCLRTSQYQWFPRPVSLFTARRDLEWREVSGHGKIFSYTIANIGNGPFRGHEPYLIALVQLDEGVNIMANIVKCDLDEIEIDMEVVPFWAPLDDGTNLLMFQPADA